jgi:predicted Rossmann fold nucleotide-binding protein DprA/Smf involved in DNA uptake
VLASYGLCAEAREEPHELLELLPATADELVRRTGRPAAEVARELVELELAGRVRAGDGIFRNAAPRG